MKIEIFYFAGCPSYANAADNVREALRLEGIAELLDLVPVETQADAQKKRLIGSPTVRIDGCDLEGPLADERGYGLGCRIYQNEQGVAGWPSIALVRRALKQG
ncbi:MAG: hypothetical protein LC114_21570 [Bryobacterales bacterium]|nr:hypothetical protein [Bryobacterales bacterium]